jgi:hypothetical protein
MYLRTAVVNVSAAYFFGFVKAMYVELLTVLTKIKLFRMSHHVDWSVHNQSFG